MKKHTGAKRSLQSGGSSQTVISNGLMLPVIWNSQANLVHCEWLDATPEKFDWKSCIFQVLKSAVCVAGIFFGLFFFLALK